MALNIRKVAAQWAEKIINILLIAILSVAFIGLVLFVVNFAKDTFINYNTKADTVSKKQDKDENKSPKSDKQKDLESNESNQDTTQQTTSNSQSLETSSQETNNKNEYQV